MAAIGRTVYGGTTAVGGVTNVGDGAAVNKGVRNGAFELRSIKGGNQITVTQEEDTIEIDTNGNAFTKIAYNGPDDEGIAIVHRVSPDLDTLRVTRLYAGPGITIENHPLTGNPFNFTGLQISATVDGGNVFDDIQQEGSSGIEVVRRDGSDSNLLLAKKIRAGDGIDVSVSTPDGGIVVSSTVEIPEIPTVPGHTAGANVKISDSGSDKVFRTWAQQGLLWYMYLDSGIGYVTLGGETPNSWEVLGTWNPEIARLHDPPILSHSYSFAQTGGAPTNHEGWNQHTTVEGVGKHISFPWYNGVAVTNNVLDSNNGNNFMLLLVGVNIVIYDYYNENFADLADESYNGEIWQQNFFKSYLQLQMSYNEGNTWETQSTVTAPGPGSGAFGGQTLTICTPVLVPYTTNVTEVRFRVRTKSTFDWGNGSDPSIAEPSRRILTEDPDTSSPCCFFWGIRIS